MHLKVALFCDTTPDFLERALEEKLKAVGFSVAIHAFPYTSPLAVSDQLEQIQPDVVVLWYAVEVAAVRGFVDLAPIVALPYTFIVANMVTQDDGVYGSSALLTPTALRARQIAWNAHLQTLAQTQQSVHPVDLELLVSRLGREQTFDPRLWETASLAFLPMLYPRFAALIVKKIAVLFGKVRKVLVTDLDNTLWSGIASEGTASSEAPGRPAYQRWLKALAARGVLLAIASKNDRTTVDQALATLPLPFSSTLFTAIEASWEPKPYVLQRIAHALGVGLESFVFIDDRPEERAAVRELLPEVAVPEMPKDPTQWGEYLASSNLFEALPLTQEDLLRTQSQVEEVQRKAVAQSMTPEAWLQTLQQCLTPLPLDATTRARAAQLMQRCNQFNASGARLTEQALSHAKGWVYHLKDRFGDLGIISVVVMNEATIQHWALSCRALNRGIEQQILAHLKQSYPVLTANYHPTGRNGRCEQFFRDNQIAMHDYE